MINYLEIQKRIDTGLITSRKHLTLPIEILNYTQKVQFEKLWDPYTKMCRGLILDENHNIIARPFPKFFNLGETPETSVQNLPNEIPQITEKLDGCFSHHTALNLWNGGIVYIGDVVNKKIQPTLIGMKDGKVVPCEIIDWYNSGTKNNWLEITLDCNVSTKSGMGKFTNKLRVTNNHHIFINRRFQSIINAKIGDEVTSFELQPDSNITHTIESGLLGDGSLSIQGNTAQYGDNHKQEHIQYSNYIKEWLGVSYKQSKNTISGFGTQMTNNSSKHYKLLKKYRDLWYPDGKKCIPKDLTWIDDFSVAKWYMDDGSLSHNDSQNDRATFSTCGFKYEDVLRLAKRLEQMYRVNCTVYDENYPSIRINSGLCNEIDRFWTAIAPHIVPVMRYKLPKKYRLLQYVPRISGTDSLVPISSHIIDIKRIEPTKKNFPSGRRGFDIKTTTGNYFAKGILVHNSFGILYFENDLPSIATRGSFESPQSLWATNWIRIEGYTNYDFIKDYTYLFEIICKESKNVVNYDFEALILIAVISNKDNTELDIKQEAEKLGISYVDHYKFKDLNQAEKYLKEKSGTELEGFVCKYSNGLRVKIKSDDYKRLHKILSGFTEINIWEALSREKSLDSMIDIVPDEFFKWIKETELKFISSKIKLIKEATKISTEALKLSSRKDQAIYIISHTKDSQRGFSGLVFALLDNNTKQAEKFVWNILKP